MGLGKSLAIRGTGLQILALLLAFFIGKISVLWAGLGWQLELLEAFMSPQSKKNKATGIISLLKPLSPALPVHLRLFPTQSSGFTPCNPFKPWHHCWDCQQGSQLGGATKMLMPVVWELSAHLRYPLDGHEVVAAFNHCCAWLHSDHFLELSSPFVRLTSMVIKTLFATRRHLL